MSMKFLKRLRKLHLLFFFSEEANRPANLKDRIIFKSQKKREATEEEKPKKKVKTQPSSSKLLSFDDEDLDD